MQARCTHFSDEEMKAQGDEGTGLWPRSQEGITLEPGAPSGSGLAPSFPPPRCPAQPRPHPAPEEGALPCDPEWPESERDGNGNEEARRLRAHTGPGAAARPPPTASKLCSKTRTPQDLASCSQFRLRCEPESSRFVLRDGRNQGHERVRGWHPPEPGVSPAWQETTVEKSPTRHIPFYGEMRFSKSQWPAQRPREDSHRVCIEPMSPLWSSIFSPRVSALTPTPGQAGPNTSCPSPTKKASFPAHTPTRPITDCRMGGCTGPALTPSDASFSKEAP